MNKIIILAALSVLNFSALANGSSTDCSLSSGLDLNTKIDYDISVKYSNIDASYSRGVFWKRIYLPAANDNNKMSNMSERLNYKVKDTQDPVTFIANDSRGILHRLTKDVTISKSNGEKFSNQFITKLKNSIEQVNKEVNKGDLLPHTMTLNISDNQKEVEILSLNCIDIQGHE
jgi:hypothetical protein